MPLEAARPPDTLSGDLPEGTVIGDHFVVSRKLGGGGMGEVYLAQHATLPHIKRAIKLLRPELSSNAGFVAMLRGEADRQSKLQHDNVVPILDFLQWRSRYCLVQAFVPGQTLSELIDATSAGMPIPQALNLIGDVLTGLNY